MPGAHKPLVSQELLHTVQAMLKKNSGRPESVQSKPGRDYLLKKIIRCAYCGMLMCSRTYNNGQRYYRECKGSRSHAICKGAGGSGSCYVADNRIGRIVGAIELRPRWLEEVLAVVSLQNELQRVKEERSKGEETLKAEMARSLTTAGTMLGNPVDPGHYARDWTDMMHLLEKWEETDMVLWQIAPDIEALQAEAILQYISQMRCHTLQKFNSLSKPKAVIAHGMESDLGLQALIDTRKACAENKVAFYPSIYRAARAISRYMDYCERDGSGALGR